VFALQVRAVYVSVETIIGFKFYASSTQVLRNFRWLCTRKLTNMTWSCVCFDIKLIVYFICACKGQPEWFQSAWHDTLSDHIFPFFNDAAHIVFSPDDFSCAFRASAIESRPLEIQASDPPSLGGLAGAAPDHDNNALIAQPYGGRVNAASCVSDYVSFRCGI